MARHCDPKPGRVSRLCGRRYDPSGRSRLSAARHLALAATQVPIPGSVPLSTFEEVGASPIPNADGMIPLMKITDPRIMKTMGIATVVSCALLIGYLSAQVSRSTQDWVLLASMTVILV